MESINFEWEDREGYNPRPGYTTVSRFFFRLPFYFFNQAEEIEERGINWFDSRWRWISTPRAWPDIIL